MSISDERLEAIRDDASSPTVFGGKRTNCIIRADEVLAIAKELQSLRAAAKVRSEAADFTSEERRRRAAGPSEVKWPMPDPLQKYKEADLSAIEGDGVGATHRYVKRGTEYVLIGMGRMQAEGWYQNVHVDFAEDPKGRSRKPETVDMREVAIYRSVAVPTEIWVRPREEFEDGRFAALTPTSREGM